MIYSPLELLRHSFGFEQPPSQFEKRKLTATFRQLQLVAQLLELV